MAVAMRYLVRPPTTRRPVASPIPRPASRDREAIALALFSSPSFHAAKLTVQDRAPVLPLRYELIYQDDEVRVVSRFEKMHPFVNHDVFEARRRLE